MKQIILNFFKLRYSVPVSVAAVLLVAVICGWMNFFAIVYIGYLLWLFAALIRKIIKNTVSVWLRYISIPVLCIGLSPVFAIGLIPFWIVGVVHRQNNPVLKQDVPEYKAWNGILRNASYFGSYQWKAWEGEISEKDFITMADKNGWNIKSFSKPEIIERTASGFIREHLCKKQGKVFVPLAVDVSCGYTYDRRQANGGGINVIWDKARQKVYICSNPR